MIDVSELESFARNCEAAAADLKPYAGKVLEEAGEDVRIQGVPLFPQIVIIPWGLGEQV